MSDVAMYDEELKALEDQITGLLHAMDRLSADQRLEKYNKAQDTLKRLNKTFHQFKVEVRVLEGSDQAVYEKKSAQHNATITQLKDQLAAKRAEANAPAAAAGPAVGSPGGAGGNDGRRGDGKDEARTATKRIERTQNDALAALTRSEKIVDETETIGNDAANTLRKQTEQIKKMNDDLDQLDSEVNRAKKELNAFIRRMMTDKIILCFAVLIVIGIIVIVVLKMKVLPGSAVVNVETSVPTTIAPAAPTPPSPPSPPSAFFAFRAF